MAELFLQGTPPSSDQAARPTKRRKFYRKRNDEEDEEDSDGLKAFSPYRETTIAPLTLDELAINQGGTSADKQEPSEDNVVSIADILRLRKAAQRKKGGIEFTNTSSNSKLDEVQLDHNAFEADEAVANTEKMVNRFAPQTGQVADVDKHMYV